MQINTRRHVDNIYEDRILKVAAVIGGEFAGSLAPALYDRGEWLMLATHSELFLECFSSGLDRISVLDTRRMEKVENGQRDTDRTIDATSEGP